MESIVEKIFKSWKTNNVVTFKVDEKQAFLRALKAIQDEFQKEVDLEREVNKMLDDLERQHPGEFQRYKMYPILKQKLAKEKKVIL